MVLEWRDNSKMNEFTDFLQDLRLRRLGETDNQDFLQGNPEPEPEPLEDLVDETPAATTLAAHLAAPPEQPRTGVGRGILGVLAGALGGFGQSATAGAALGQGVIEEPYRRSISQYNQKSKGLAGLAEIESQGLNRKRLFEQHREALKQRQIEAEERALDHAERRKALENRPPRQYQPKEEYDEQGFATGRVFDPDELVMKEVPGLKGFRRSAESPAITQKKAANKVALDKATELQGIFDRLTEKGTKGTWHVGPGQGYVSELLTGIGGINDPDVRDLHKLTEELANERLYALSGAQINNKEYERLRRTMASTNKSEAAFRTDLERFLRFQKAAMKGLISENDVNWTPEMSDDPEINPNKGQANFGGGTPTQAPKRRYTIERVPQ